LLAAHPDIASFPESFFFNNLVPYRKWLQKLGIASRSAKPKFKQFLCESGHEEMEKYLPRVGLFMEQYAQAFVKILDILTEQQSKKFWLEKTPSHLHYINEIEKLVKEAKFIHIIRNGADVVASLYEVTHKYPKIWGGSRDINQCIGRWIKDVRISQAHIHKPNHKLVLYEQLIEDRQSVLTELCDFMGTKFVESMLQDYTKAAEGLVLESEPWKASVSQAVQNTNNKKFYKLFDEEQRQYILEQLAEIDMSKLNINLSLVEKSLL
jgi:hypothetical protein